MNPIIRSAARVCGMSACLCALLFAALSPVNAAVTANFSNASADFPSSATGGWNEPWIYNAIPDWVDTKWAEVRATSPLNGGGNYLSIYHVSMTGGPYDDGTWISREFNGDATLDLHKPYKIAFDFRAYYAGKNQLYGDGGWSLSTDGAGLSWKFKYLNNGSAAWIDTGIPHSNTGQVYHVEISLSPTTLTFVATLSNGTTTYTTPTLSSPDGYSTHRSAFKMEAFAQNAYGSTFGFDLDNLEITQLAYTPVSTPSDYYVASSGSSDFYTGTSSSPWATVAKAFASVPPNQGKVIHIGPGVFDLGGTLAVPPGVTVTGSGVGITTLVGALDIKRRDEITLADFSMSGNNLAYKHAISISQTFNTQLRDLGIDGYEDNALLIYRADTCSFSRITITDSARVELNTTPIFQTQAINMGRLKDCTFTGLSINTRDKLNGTAGRGGQGIGTGDDTWLTTLAPENQSATYFFNVSITHSNFIVDLDHATAGGSPQFCLELWHANLIDVNIGYNTFNRVVSISVDPGLGDNVRVHHNNWTSTGYFFEASADNIEFDHNVLEGGKTPLNYFGGGKRLNLNAHHNVFKNQQDQVMVANFPSGSYDNFVFVNNTVIGTSNRKGFNTPHNSSNQTISNNVFVGPTAVDLFEAGTTAGVTNNYFSGILPVGSSTISGPANFTATGTNPDPYYRPLAGSALLDAGILIPGITEGYVGKKPDLGAYERGTGITREYWTGVTGNTVASLTGNAAYPFSPTGADTLPGLRSTHWNNSATTANWADNYGERLRGFITAPASGLYEFWIAADDAAELWLSTDDNPANRVRIASVNAYTKPNIWNTEANQRSSANMFTFANGVPGRITLTAGRRYYVEVLHKEGIGLDHLSVGWLKPTDLSSGEPSEIVPDQVLTPWIATSGSLTREYWTGITGIGVAALTGSTAYPLAPTDRDTITSGRATSWLNPAVTQNWDNNYGQRVRGFITAPSTGAYTFWVSGDDNCELWLSTDDQPTNKVRIAQVTTYTSQDDWTKEAGQKSAAITLTAGRRYYLEALQKEAGGDDSLSIGWRKPTDAANAAPVILPATALAPYGQ